MNIVSEEEINTFLLDKEFSKISKPGMPFKAALDAHFKQCYGIPGLTKPLKTKTPEILLTIFGGIKTILVKEDNSFVPILSTFPPYSILSKLEFAKWASKSKGEFIVPPELETRILMLEITSLIVPADFCKGDLLVLLSNSSKILIIVNSFEILKTTIDFSIIAFSKK